MQTDPKIIIHDLTALKTQQHDFTNATIDGAIELLKKELPRSLRHHMLNGEPGLKGECLNCGRHVVLTGDLPYCPKCGQRLV